MNSLPLEASGASVCQLHRVIVHRGQARSYRDRRIRWSVWAAFRLARELGDAVFQADHQTLWERCLPAMQATRFVRQTALSFIAGKRAPTGITESVGACGRHSDLPANWATRYFRQSTKSSGSGACPRCRRRGLSGTPSYRSSRASSLLQGSPNPLERGLPAMQATKFVRQTALSFIASKLGSHSGSRGARCRDYRKSRMSRSSLRPTKIEIDSRTTENATRMPIESSSGPCPPIRAER